MPSRRAPAAALLAALLGVACESETVTLERGFTSTAALQGRRRLIVDTVVPVRVLGERRGDDALVRLSATLTASAAEVAERALDAYAIVVDLDADPAAALIRVPAPSEGVIGGSVEVRAPFELDLQVRSRNGTAEVGAMEGAIRVDSLRSARVTEAEDDLVVRVEGGNALVDALARPGQRVDVAVGSGDVEVALPVPLDAIVEAASTAGVESAHPSLPSRPANVPYLITAGRGLTSVVATTRRGAVVFVPRRRD